MWLKPFFSRLTLPQFLLIILMLHRSLAQKIIIEFDDSVTKGEAFRLNRFANLAHDVGWLMYEVGGRKLLLLCNNQYFFCFFVCCRQRYIPSTCLNILGRLDKKAHVFKYLTNLVFCETIVCYNIF